MISSEVNKISDYKKELKITVSADDLEKIRNKQIKEIKRDAELPGYRKGHAPLHLITQKYRNRIEQFTLDVALEHGIKEAFAYNKIRATGRPVLKKINYDDHKNLFIQVEVDVFPEIELKKYKGLEIEKIIYKITESDVDNQLELLRKQYATITSLENDIIKIGHYVTMTIQELDASNVPIVGKKYDNIRIQLGQGNFDQELEGQLIGLKKGDEKIIHKAYPGNYTQKQLAGKIERYSVKIEKVEQEDLPEINQDFIRGIDPGIESIDQLRERIKYQLEIKYKYEAENRLYNQLIHELLQLNPFEVPETLISEYLEQIVKDIKKKDKNADEEAIRKNYRVDALFHLKWYYLKQIIAEEENLKIDNQEMRDAIEKMENKTLREQYLNDDNLKKQLFDNLFEKKLFYFIMDHSKIKIKEEPIVTLKDIK